MRSKVIAWAGLACVICSAGCGTTESNQGFSTRIVVARNADELFADGRSVLMQEFGGLESSDGQSRRLVTVANEFTTRRESGTGRDLYGNATRMRRFATFQVQERGRELVARIRVDVERQDNGRVQAMQRPWLRVSDYPADETAAERDAATDVRQNELWTRVRRDRELESGLLAQIVRDAERGGAQISNVRAAEQPPPAPAVRSDETAEEPPPSQSPARQEMTEVVAPRRK